MITAAMGGKTEGGLDDSNETLLVIYLPHNDTPITIKMDETATVSVVIQSALREHRQRGILPPLEYSRPALYELRMHEGEGEPDMDFAAFKPDDVVSSLFVTSQSNEFCLCSLNDCNGSDDDSDLIEKPTRRASARAPPPLYRGDATGTSVSDDHGERRLSERSRSTTSLLQSSKSENVVFVFVAVAGLVPINFTDTTTLRDILPIIADKHKLRLYTDEYIFAISTEQQKKLKVFSLTFWLN